MLRQFIYGGNITIKERIIKVYDAPKLPPFDQYWTAFALDEDDNLVWVTNYTTDDPVLNDEIDNWYAECVQEIPDYPVPLHKWDYKFLDCNHKERREIGEITLRYIVEEDAND